MKRISFYFTCILALTLLSISSFADERPNIIFIFADDLGYGDVGYHGNNKILTPNIDALARSGVHFSQGYVSASVCGPSRAGALTGVYQQRFGVGENPSGSGYPDNMKFPMAGLPRSQPIISETLKAQGYHTGMIGKWHLGFDLSLRPNQRGFDFFYGFINGSHDYTGWHNKFSKKKGFWPLFLNEEMLPPQKDIYLTDLFSEQAVGFVKSTAKKEQPFFLYLAYNSVHHPWQATKSTLARTKNLSNSEDFNVFAAMMLSMDDGIGRLNQTLQELKIANNTLIVFMSDNGSPSGQGLNKKAKKIQKSKLERGGIMSNAGIYRGYKGDTYEGGIRVPFLMTWPTKITAGTRYDHPVSALDLAPTFAALAGENTEKPKLGGFAYDGVNLLPFIQGKMAKTKPHSLLVWRRDNDYAIRSGDWKLSWNDDHGNRKIELFNIANDPGEYHDVSAQHPELTQSLQDKFDAWDSTLPANEWWGAPWNRNTDFNQGKKLEVATFNQNPPNAKQAKRKIK